MSHPLTVQPGAVPARFRNAGIALFLLILAAGAAYVISHLVSDLESVAASSVFPFVLLDRKSTRLNSSHIQKSRMPSSA